MSESAKMIVVLVTVCVISAFTLSLVYGQTKPMIDDNKKAALEQALLRVHPDASSVEELAVEEGMLKNGFKLMDADGGHVGYGLLIEFQGFNGPIKAVYGVDEDFRITGLEIVEHTDTPGLGSKIAEEDFRSRFTGATKDDFEVDAITGATISSKAVVESVKETLTNAPEVLE